MNSLSSLQQSLRGKSRLERIAILKIESESLSEPEKEKYIRFYEHSQIAFKTQKTVTQVVIELSRQGLFFQSQSYFPLEYNIACIVTGNPVQEPRDVLEEAKKSRICKPKQGVRTPAMSERCRMTLDRNKRYEKINKNYEHD